MQKNGEPFAQEGGRRACRNAAVVLGAEGVSLSRLVALNLSLLFAATDRPIDSSSCMNASWRCPGSVRATAIGGFVLYWRRRAGR